MMLKTEKSIVFADHIGSNMRDCIRREVFNDIRIDSVKKNGKIRVYVPGGKTTSFDFSLGVRQQHFADQLYRQIVPIVGGLSMVVRSYSAERGHFVLYVVSWRTLRPGAAKLPVSIADVMGELRSAMAARDGETARHVLLEWAARTSPGDEVISGLLEHLSSHMRRDHELMDSWPVDWLSTLHEHWRDARWQPSTLPVSVEVADGTVCGLMAMRRSIMRDEPQELDATLGVRPWLTSKFALSSDVATIKVLTNAYLTLARGMALQDERAGLNSDAAAEELGKLGEADLVSVDDIDSLESSIRSAALILSSPLRNAMHETIPYVGTHAAIIRLINECPAHAAHFAEFGFGDWYSRENRKDGTQPRGDRMLSLADYVEADHFSTHIHKLYNQMGSLIVRNARSQGQE